MVRYQHPFPKATNYDASDPYGMDPPPPFRTDPHRGVDYNGPDAGLGAAIPAIADGVVVDINGSLGNRVVIQHPDGVFSGYAHMRYPTPLAMGAHVTRGQTVGQVGDTGAEGAVHLHLAMGFTLSGANGTDPYWTNHFDPIAYIDARLNDADPGVSISEEKDMYVRRESTGEVALFGPAFRNSTSPAGRHIFASQAEYDNWRLIVLAYNGQIDATGGDARGKVAVPPAVLSLVMGVNEANWGLICGLYGV